jgi:phenylacetate-CoA ligase
MRRMPASEIEAAGRAIVSPLLRHAAALVPFYRPIAAVLDAAADGDAAAWVSLPIVTGNDLRRLGPEGLASALPDGEEALPPSRSWTSLSTPMDGPLGLLGDIADKAQWEFVAYSFGVDTTARLVAILPSTAIGRGDLAEAFEPWSIDAHRGRANRLPDHLDPATTLTFLENIQPACLFADPLSVRRLLDVARPGRLVIKDILVWQPARQAALAVECRHVFGARLIEVVASSLCGFLASACPSGPFVPAFETTFVEVVDADGCPCRPGQPGQLVLTALYSYHRPVIRHDVGLRAVWENGESLDKLSSGRPSFRLLRQG